MKVKRIGVAAAKPIAIAMIAMGLVGGLVAATQASEDDDPPAAVEPVPPLNFRPYLQVGESIVIPRSDALDGLSARLIDGHELDVRVDSQGFVVDTTSLSAGTYSLVLEQSFNEGRMIAFPITFDIGDGRFEDFEGSDSIALSSAGSMRFPFGEPGGLSLSIRPESEAIGPQSLAVTTDGLHVLNTAGRSIVRTGPNQELVPMADLDSGSYTDLAFSPSGEHGVAVDMIRGAVLDLRTGTLTALPDIARYLPANTRFVVTDAGIVAAQSPVDSTTYGLVSVATGVPVEVLPEDGPRAWVQDADSVLVQFDMSQAPKRIPASNATILSHAVLTNGFVALLLSEESVEHGGAFTNRIVVTDGRISSSSPVEFDASITMTKHIVAAPNGEVVLAQVSREALEVTIYQVVGGTK